MASEAMDVAFKLVGSLALLWTGVTLIRIAERFAGADVPAPFNTAVETFQSRRRWRDWACLVCAGVGSLLIIGAAIRLVI